MKRKLPQKHRRRQRAIKQARSSYPGAVWVQSDVMPVLSFSDDADTGFYVSDDAKIKIVNGGWHATTITPKT